MIISAIIKIKYKIVYQVKIDGENIGYISKKTEFDEIINTQVLNLEDENIEFVTVENMPEYELKFVDRKQETNEEKIISKLKENSQITYKFFAVNLDGETKATVKNIDEAQKIVEQLKEEYKEYENELDIQVIEKYTESIENTEDIEIAKTNLEEEINDIIEKSNQININGIIIENNPLENYTYISSRYGSYSKRRISTHTGLDLACPKGTPIKAIAGGTVTFAAYNGAYGKLVKIDHGNGVETWYAHCSSIDVKVGESVSAGTIIAKVGSTGNSTGPHLHLEIRIDGNTINPEEYLY